MSEVEVYTDILDVEPACEYDVEAVFGGVSAHDDAIEAEVAEFSAMAASNPMRFKFQGPLDVPDVKTGRFLTSDGITMTYTYEWTYTAALQHHIHSRQKVKEWVRSVLEASNWFARARIRMRYVDDPRQAKTIITYAPKSQVCGGIGCTRTFPANNRKDQILIASERFGPPFFAVLPHEMCHSCLTAVDQYPGVRCHDPNYHGLMGNGTGVMTDNDVTCMKAWLRGEGRICQAATSASNFSESR